MSPESYIKDVLDIDIDQLPESYKKLLAQVILRGFKEEKIKYDPGEVSMSDPYGVDEDGYLVFLLVHIASLAVTGDMDNIKDRHWYFSCLVLEDAFNGKGISVQDQKDFSKRLLKIRPDIYSEWSKVSASRLKPNGPLEEPDVQELHEEVKASVKEAMSNRYPFFTNTETQKTEKPNDEEHNDNKGPCDTKSN